VNTPNRVVLVDETGRVYDRTGIALQLEEQDNGLTLKVFVEQLPAGGQSRRRPTSGKASSESQATSTRHDLVIIGGGGLRERVIRYE
jgi:hypothetical protein